MSARVVLLVMLAACGRYGFGVLGSDTSRDGGSDPDGGGGGDGGMADGTQMTLDGMSGDSATAGNWTAFAPSPPNVDYYAVWAFAANNVWIGGSQGAVSQFDGTTWTARAGVVDDINMLWGASPNDVWAVSRLCEVKRWNGAQWNAFTVPGCNNESFFGVGGVSTTDVWLVGVGGRIDHFVMGAHTPYTQAQNRDIWSVWAVSASDAYFVGTRGSLFHWNGTTVVDESLASNLTITSVWATNSNDVWVVGSDGVIFHKLNGGAWTQVTSPTTQFLYWVGGRAANDIWALGDLGVALHYDGSQWSQVSMPVNVALRALAAVPGGGLRLVGHSGTLLQHP